MDDQTILSNNRPLLICFSHLRWRFVYQRPQHLMSRAAADWSVIFFEEPTIDLCAIAPRADITRCSSGVIVVVPILPPGTSKRDSIAAQEAVLDSLLAQHPGSLRVFWYYTPQALEFSHEHKSELCVYDCMDELSAFKGASRQLGGLEKILFKRVDLVFTGGRSLYEAKRNSHANVHLFPSSVDKEHFSIARQLTGNDPTPNIPHPRIGFFGVIDERFDIDLLARLAEDHPEWNFVLLGPVVKIDPADLPLRANIHWAGFCDYADLPNHLAHWDVGLMPFALNESTQYISPTKTPEFLAAGVRVVSTPVRDVVRDWGDHGLVEIARDAPEFANKISAILKRSKDEWLAAVDHRLAHQSWSDTWQRMSQLMRRELTWKRNGRELAPGLHCYASNAVEVGNV